jgi:hypothetical protein
VWHFSQHSCTVTMNSHSQPRLHTDSHAPDSVAVWHEGRTVSIGCPVQTTVRSDSSNSETFWNRTRTYTLFCLECLILCPPRILTL